MLLSEFDHTVSDRKSRDTTTDDRDSFHKNVRRTLVCRAFVTRRLTISWPETICRDKLKFVGHSNTAVIRTNIVTRAMQSNHACRRSKSSFKNKFPNHTHKQWMGTCCCCTNHSDSEFVRNFRCMHVEIVDYLHVIGDKP